MDNSLCCDMRSKYDLMILAFVIRAGACKLRKLYGSIYERNSFQGITKFRIPIGLRMWLYKGIRASNSVRDCFVTSGASFPP